MLSRYATLKSLFSNPLRTWIKDEFFFLTLKGVEERVFMFSSLNLVIHAL